MLERTHLSFAFAPLLMPMLMLGCAPTAAPCPASPPVVATPPSVPSSSSSASTGAPLAIGETFSLDSKVLGERRTINVYLPPGYTENVVKREIYPVLYMLDGGIKEDFPHVTGNVDVSIKNEAMRPFLVVGVENTERRRDLVGPTTVAEEHKIAPHAGGADRFRQFFREELKPEIARRYRVTAESAIVGESFAGLFVIETLLVDPDLFDSYVSVSPSLWWNDKALARGAAARLKAWPAKAKRVFLATADEKGMEAGAVLLDSTVREVKPKGLDWHYLPMPEEQHSTIFPFAALKGFRLLFPPTKTGGG